MERKPHATADQVSRLAATMELLNANLVRLNETLPRMNVEIANLKARLDLIDGGDIFERPN